MPRLAPWRDDFSAGLDGFDHYLSETLVPEHELLPDLTLILASGLIDSMYYRINPIYEFENELDPALHYCRYGGRRGLRPSTAFDPDWYVETNAVVGRLAINPLTHYILEGEASNRRPTIWFDPLWYRSEYHVAEDDLALAHYLRHRLDRRVSPNAMFDIAWYLARHGDLIPPDVDPFSHYLLAGTIRDIDPSPRFNARAWRHRHMAPLAAEGQSELPVPARNPLVHFLRRQVAN